VAFYSSLQSCNEKIKSASGEEIDKLLREHQLVACLALLMKVRGLKNYDELDRTLRELETSLERQIDEFGEQIIGMELVLRDLPSCGRSSKRQEAEQRLLDRLRAATTVWTIYDDPS
jgi:hypothetical protein